MNPIYSLIWIISFLSTYNSISIHLSIFTGNYGEMAMINLPKPFKAKEVIIGIVGFDNNPCLKFELMGCEDEPEERRHLGRLKRNIDD